MRGDLPREGSRNQADGRRTATESPEAITYAAALRTAIAPYLAAGGTQRAIAESIGVAEGTLSRYLSGTRSAPIKNLPLLQNFLAREGYPVPKAAYENLRREARRAHQSGGSALRQLEVLEEERARDRAIHTRKLRFLGRRLAGLQALLTKTQRDRALEQALAEDQARHLRDELRSAIERAHAAEAKCEELTVQVPDTAFLRQVADQHHLIEAERDALYARVQEQDERLRAAQDYARAIEADYAEQLERTRLLEQEAKRLRAASKMGISPRHRGIKLHSVPPSAVWRPTPKTSPRVPVTDTCPVHSDSLYGDYD